MPMPRSLSVKRFVEGKSPPADLEGELLLGALQQFEALGFTPRPAAIFKAMSRGDRLHGGLEKGHHISPRFAMPPGIEVHGGAILQVVTECHAAANHDLGGLCMAGEALEQFARERMEITGWLGERRGHAPIFISWPHDDNPVALSCSN